MCVSDRHTPTYAVMDQLFLNTAEGESGTSPFPGTKCHTSVTALSLWVGLVGLHEDFFLVENIRVALFLGFDTVF